MFIFCIICCSSFFGAVMIKQIVAPSLTPLSIWLNVQPKTHKRMLCTTPLCPRTKKDIKRKEHEIVFILRQQIATWFIDTCIFLNHLLVYSVQYSYLIYILSLECTCCPAISRQENIGSIPSSNTPWGVYCSVQHSRAIGRSENLGGHNGRPQFILVTGQKLKKTKFWSAIHKSIQEFFDPYLFSRSCAPPLDKCFCQLGGGAQDQENKQGSRNPRIDLWIMLQNFVS